MSKAPYIGEHLTPEMILHTGVINRPGHTPSRKENILWADDMRGHHTSKGLKNKTLVCIDGPKAGRLFDIKRYFNKEGRMTINASKAPLFPDDEFRPFRFAILNCTRQMVRKSWFSELLAIVAQDEGDEFIKEQPPSPDAGGRVVASEHLEIEEELPPEPKPAPAPVASKAAITKEGIQEQQVWARVEIVADEFSGERKRVLRDVRKVIALYSVNSPEDTVVVRELGREEIRIPNWQITDPNASRTKLRDKQPVEVGMDVFLAMLNNLKMELVTDVEMLERISAV